MYQILAGKDRGCEGAWEMIMKTAIQLASYDILAPKDRKTEPYKLMDSKSMVGCFSMIFVRSHLAPQVRGLYNAKIQKGLGGNAGNKGAIVNRL